MPIIATKIGGIFLAEQIDGEWRLKEKRDSSLEKFPNIALLSYDIDLTTMSLS